MKCEKHKLLIPDDAPDQSCPYCLLGVPSCGDISKASLLPDPIPARGPAPRLGRVLRALGGRFQAWATWCQMTSEFLIFGPLGEPDDV